VAGLGVVFAFAPRPLPPPHPEESDDPAAIRFGATLPSPGRFLRFKHDGVVRTVAHTLVVPR
jgi:hypothetical protein